MKRGPAPKISPLAAELVRRIIAGPPGGLMTGPLDALAYEIARGLCHQGWPRDQRKVLGGRKSGAMRKGRQVLRRAIIDAVFDTLPASITAHPRSGATISRVEQELDVWKKKGIIGQEVAKVVSAAPDTIRDDLNANGARSRTRRLK